MSLTPNRHEFFSLKTAEVEKNSGMVILLKKKILKEKRPKNKIPLKVGSGSREQFPPLFPPTPIKPRLFTTDKPIC